MLSANIGIGKRRAECWREDFENFYAILDTIRSTLDSVFIVSLRAEWYGFELSYTKFSNTKH